MALQSPLNFVVICNYTAVSQKNTVFCLSVNEGEMAKKRGHSATYLKRKISRLNREITDIDDYLYQSNRDDDQLLYAGMLERKRDDMVRMAVLQLHTGIEDIPARRGYSVGRKALVQQPEKRVKERNQAKHCSKCFRAAAPWVSI